MVALGFGLTGKSTMNFIQAWVSDIVFGFLFEMHFVFSMYAMQNIDKNTSQIE
jgi:hypothetical protein